MALTEQKSNLLGLNLEELEEFAVSNGQPRYRGRQLYHGIYARRARIRHPLDLNHAFRDMDLHPNTKSNIRTRSVIFCSLDGSIRYLFRLNGNMVETVYMPEEDRTTTLFISWVGCAVDCKFCFTRSLESAISDCRRNRGSKLLAVAAGQNIPRVTPLKSCVRWAWVSPC